MQRAMNKAAIRPTGGAKPMPLAYRLWRQCESHNTLWWRGNMAAQPKLLMMEFDACRRATGAFEDYLRGTMQIVRDAAKS